VIAMTLKVYATELLKLAMSKNINDDLRIELIGILTNIQLGKEWIEHLKNSQFMEFIAQNISLGVSEVKFI
jgi:NADH:ubiquinone oxidoreductase subunit E